MAKGTVVEINQNSRNGYIQPEAGGQWVYFQLNWVKDIPPSGNVEVGMPVEFESRQTNNRLETVQVRYSGSRGISRFSEATKSETAVKLPPTDSRFLNPYNFVRYLPPQPTVEHEEVKLLGRSTPPPHDRWLGLSGHLECQLETITPLFVSDASGIEEKKKITEKKKHYSYRFFRIGDKKAIPATTLRGVIRSIYEAVTNSDFSNLTDAQLSYRLDGREIQQLVPALVVKRAGVEQTEQGENKEAIKWYLHLLPGKLLPNQPPFDPEMGQKKGLYAAPVRFYKAVKPSGRHREQPEPVDNPDTWQHGQQCHAILLRMKFPPSWRAIALAKTKEDAERLMAQKKNQFRSDSELIIRQGWLCKTLQNADNKNSERFFFREPGRNDIPDIILLPKDVRQNYEALIADYRERHTSDVAKRETPAKVEITSQGTKEIAYSRFILQENKDEEKLKGGELVYVSLRRSQIGQLEVKFIAPVSWPRVAYKHTIGDLLPRHLHRCDNYDALCPACRLFGWVHTAGYGQQKIAYAGRLRFTHALLQSKENSLPPQTLAILGSPKPTTTRFYLAGPNGKPSDKPRSDFEAGYDGNNGRNRLRGRKFYRHFIPNDEFRLSQEPSDQNRTVHDAESPGANFTFQIEFENLALVELGALLWSLTLGGKGSHRLGYGKPLGMGSVEIRVTKLYFYDLVARYTFLDNIKWQKEVLPKTQGELVNIFQEMMTRPYATPQVIAYAEEHGATAWQRLFEQLPNIQDILALSNKTPPTLPVHYPYAPDPNTQGQFEWFVGNKRLNGPRVELGTAVDDPGLPFIKRDGTKW